MRGARQRRSGLVLLEVMVALVVLSLVGLGALQLIHQSHVLVADAHEWSEAVAYAEDGMELAKLGAAPRATGRCTSRRVSSTDHAPPVGGRKRIRAGNGHCLSSRRGPVRPRPAGAHRRGWGRAVVKRMRRQYGHRRRGNRRGVALIFVLWILVLFGLAMSELVARARTEARMVATLKSRAVAQYAAESGILATTTSMRMLLDSATDQAALALRARHLDTLGRAAAGIALGEEQFAVSVLDLNARLDLVHADSTVLRAFFAEFVPGERADAIVAGLRAVPVTRFAELARVPGADDALALAVAPYVTALSDGFINVNTAPEPVLAALPGIGQAKAHALVQRREAGDPFTSADAFRPTPGSGVAVPVEGTLLTIAPTRLLIVSRGWQRGSPLTHEIQAVYLVFAGALTLQSWEERDR